VIWVLVGAPLLHILGGISWVGSALTTVFIIEPTATALLRSSRWKCVPASR
jgi:uncharacterized membrane protein